MIQRSEQERAESPPFLADGPQRVAGEKSGEKSLSDLTNRRLRLLLKEAFFIVWLQVLALHPSFSAPHKKIENRAAKTATTHFTDKELLKKSQISYHAVGGFTGVKSYSVMISCVDGHVSALSSITDPHARIAATALKKKSNMTAKEYVALWDNLKRHHVFNKKDNSKPKQDILDEFTVHFEAKVGDREHEFKVYACSRPEAAQYFAIRSLLDNAVGHHLLGLHR